MRSRALFLIAFCILGSSAFAGPNAGGTIVCHDANYIFSDEGGLPWCEVGTPLESCEAADVEVDGAYYGYSSLFRVYAAFYAGSSPRLMGLTWGVQYDAELLALAGYGKCGDFELNDNGWPAPGTGSTVTWNTVQTAHIVPVYWFTGYLYQGPGTTAILSLTGNPTQGAYFGDDTVPAILDPIAGFGTIGFDTPGQVVCPTLQPNLGACCNLSTGECTLTTAEDCADPCGWIPQFTSCDPNPCPAYVMGVCCGFDGVCTLAWCSLDCNGAFHPEWTTCNPNPCGPLPEFFVCCTPEGECMLVYPSLCDPPNILHQDLYSCDPNPCVPVPTERSSWGAIKATYR